MMASATSVRNSELTDASGAPSWDNFTKPSIADVVGTRYDTSLMTGGMASLGQEKPETMNKGRPAAARMSCTRIGLRKTPATTRPSPATDSTNGTAKIRIGTTPPRRGTPYRMGSTTRYNGRITASNV